MNYTKKLNIDINISRLREQYLEHFTVPPKLKNTKHELETKVNMQNVANQVLKQQLSQKSNFLKQMRKSDQDQDPQDQDQVVRKQKTVNTDIIVDKTPASGQQLGNAISNPIFMTLENAGEGSGNLIDENELDMSF